MLQSLPPKVYEKIMRLQDAEQQALTLTSMTVRAIGDLQRIIGNNPSGDNAQSVARELARLQGLQPDQQARHKALGNLNARVKNFLSRLPAHIELAETRTKVKLKADETHLKAVARLRGEIMTLISERGSVERSTPTNKEAKQMARDYVQSLATRVDPRLVIDHEKISVQFGNASVGSRDLTPAEILAWADPKIVMSRLEAMIDARDQSGKQMTASDRKLRLSELKIAILDLERKEQAHIDAARDEGTTIEQRVNVDPRALLGLLIVGEQSKAA